MRHNDGPWLQLLRLWLRRRQGPPPSAGGLFGRAPRRPPRRRPRRSLLRLVLLAIALALIVRACHTREVEETRPATTNGGGDAPGTKRATWL